MRPPVLATNRRGLALALACACVVAFCVRVGDAQPAPPTLAEAAAQFDERLIAELRARDPEAADWFAQASAAARAHDTTRAAELYAKVRSKLPDWSPAARRECSARAHSSDTAGAITACQAALALEDSPENQTKGVAPRNLYHASRRAPVDESEIEAAIREALERPAGPYDSHPPPAERIALVERIAAPATACADAEAPAWSLVEGRAALERRMSAVVVERVNERVQRKLTIAEARPAASDGPSAAPPDAPRDEIGESADGGSN